MQQEPKSLFHWAEISETNNFYAAAATHKSEPTRRERSRSSKERTRVTRTILLTVGLFEMIKNTVPVDRITSWLTQVLFRIYTS